MAAVPSTVSVCVVLLRAQGRCVNLVKKSAHRHKFYRLYAPRRNNGQVSAWSIEGWEWRAVLRKSVRILAKKQRRCSPGDRLVNRRCSTQAPRGLQRDRGSKFLSR